jgi:hypothetical protein
VSPKQAQLMYQGKGKDTSFNPPGGGRAAEAFHSLFSHIDGKIRSYFNLASRAIKKPNLHRNELHTNVYCLKRRPKASKSIKNDFAFAFDSFDKFFEKCHFECVV